MAGNYIIISQLFCLLIKDIKFKIPVAANAGIGSLPPLVAAYKGLDDFFPELGLIVIDVIRDSDLFADRPGILRVLQGTAGTKKILTYHVIFVEAHGTAHAVEPVFLHKHSGNAAVNAAAHSYKCFFNFFSHK